VSPRRRERLLCPTWLGWRGGVSRGRLSDWPENGTTCPAAVEGPTQGISISINYGDGTAVTTPAGGPTIKLDHLYAATGRFSIQAMATDTIGVVSQLATQKVTISTVAPEGRPQQRDLPGHRRQHRGLPDD
jgi:hypothetical protein